MTPDKLFEIVNTLVLPGWLLLMFVPRWHWTGRIIVSGIVIILALIYVIGITEAFENGDFSNFSSLEGVMQLFTQPEAVLIGWVHYLAFDLLIGWFITRDALKNGINQWIVLPCLLFTFMLGPTGWLLYWIIRTWHTRTFFPTIENR